MAVKKSTTAQAKKPANAGKKLPGRPVKDLTKIPEKKNALKEEQKLEKTHRLLCNRLLTISISMSMKWLMPLIM